MAGRTVNLQKHDAIVAAAARLFLKNGFSNTRMDDIARAARVTKQTVYGHFKSKDKLFADIITTQCLKHSPDARLLVDGALPIEALLFRVGMGFLDMISSREGLAIHRLVLSEAERKPALAKLFYDTGPRRMNELLQSYLAEQTARGKLSIENPASAAAYFYSLLKGRYHLRMALNIKPRPTRAELEVHVKETVSVFLYLYGGDSPIQTHSMSRL